MLTVHGRLSIEVIVQTHFEGGGLGDLEVVPIQANENLPRNQGASGSTDTTQAGAASHTSVVAPTNTITTDDPSASRRPKKRIVKRSEEYERARDARRMQKWIAKREAAVSVAQSRLGTLEAMKLTGGYIGTRASANQPKDTIPAVVIVPHNDGTSARLVDTGGRVFAFRGCKGAATERANACAQAAAAFLAQSQIPPTDRNGKRGDFDQYYFILHRESQKRPRMHSYFLDHTAEGLYASAIMQPLQELVNDAFQRQFPELHAHYVKVLTFILQEQDTDLIAPFFPFASFSVNYGTVVCKPHKDTINFGLGLCCIIPFGTFNPTDSARLVLAEAGVEVEVGPGIPIFIPSALITHSNTPLAASSFRGSIVLWSNGSLFQYYDLGGRPVNSLTAAERKEYDAGIQTRLQHALRRFPKII